MSPSPTEGTPKNISQESRTKVFNGPRETNAPYSAQFIVTYEWRGNGDPSDPHRRILTVWTLDGEKVAEEPDTHIEEYVAWLKAEIKRLNEAWARREES